MLLTTTHFSLILAAFFHGSAFAAPLVTEPSKFTLAFATRINATGFGTILAADQARAKALREQGATRASGNAKRASSFGVTNTAVTYTANVGVGSPPTSYTLIIDTGSSNTWVGANKPYVATSTSKSTGQPVFVSYGSGQFSGVEYTDQVTLSPSLVIESQSIGVAYASIGFVGVDGILGVGPDDLTSRTLGGSPATIPTVTDSLFFQGTISSDSLGVFYAPTTSQSNANGELTFGGVDSSKITSPVNYVPITNASPASQYWGIDQSITYGSTSILSSTAGIVDTGTTLILLATNAFNNYKVATGAQVDLGTGLLKITAAQYAALSPLNFNIGGTTYTLSPNAQIWPRSLNSQLGGSSDGIYLVVSDIGAADGRGLDFVSGYTFLERFYSVYDTTNGQVGFATTAFTSATTN